MELLHILLMLHVLMNLLEVHDRRDIELLLLLRMLWVEPGTVNVASCRLGFTAAHPAEVVAVYLEVLKHGLYLLHLE